MTTLSATQARADLFTLIKRVLRRHEPLRINHKDGDVVVLSEADYENLLETLEILSAPNFRKKFGVAKREIAAGRTVSFADACGK